MPVKPGAPKKQGVSDWSKYECTSISIKTPLLPQAFYEVQLSYAAKDNAAIIENIELFKTRWNTDYATRFTIQDIFVLYASGGFIPSGSGDLQTGPVYVYGQNGSGTESFNSLALTRYWSQPHYRVGGQNNRGIEGTSYLHLGILSDPALYPGGGGPAGPGSPTGPGSPNPASPANPPGFKIPTWGYIVGGIALLLLVLVMVSGRRK